MSEYPTYSMRSDAPNPFQRDMSKDPQEGDAQEMKKICQLVHMGLCRVMDEMERGEELNIHDALFRLKLLAQVGSHKIYPGNSFQQLADFDKKIRADLAHPKRKVLDFTRHEEKKRGVLLGKRIGGKTEIGYENQGGNVGPVFEPGVEEMEERIENVECLVEAIAPKVKIVEIEEKAR